MALTVFQSSARRRGAIASLALVIAPLAFIACRESLSGFGAGVRARASSDQFFSAFADRHLDVVRSPRYDNARIQVTRGALSPSRVFDDTTVWTASSGAVRVLEANGTRLGDKYVMTSRRGASAPAKPGDGRHITTLSRITDNQFQWETSVDFALGSVRPSDFALVISRLLSAGEGLDTKLARADIASSAPKSAAVLGTTFTIDSLHPTLLADGTTSVMLGISLHSDQLRQRYPAFGEYVHRYVDPARFRLLVTDRGGAPFFEAQARDRFLTIRVRTSGGKLVPLAGPPRPLPDTLVLNADFTVKVKVFTVGFHDLQMEFVNLDRGDNEKTWTVIARKEPKWNLPFIAARLLRAPLRAPFAGEGALLRMSVRGGEADQPTVLVRQGRLVVQESAILKFLNSLTSSAMDDFGTTVEAEKSQWLREIFVAMREDARVVLAP